MNLYKVTTENNWKGHHVIANSFEQARLKVLEYLKITGKGMINEYGDLTITPDPDKELEIKQIELVTDELIR